MKNRTPRRGLSFQLSTRPWIRLSVLVGVLIPCPTALAYDDVGISSLLRKAAEVRARGVEGALGSKQRELGEANDKLGEGVTLLDEAFARLISECDGRVGALRSRLRKQVVRGETISIAGGLIGVVGAIATCPHCAALASGLAGLANPLQQTFKENSDTPQDTREELRRISELIRSELDAYRKLPQPISTEPGYQEKLLNRIDALRFANASCKYYAEAERSVQGDTSSDPTASAEAEIN